MQTCKEAELQREKIERKRIIETEAHRSREAEAHIYRKGGREATQLLP